ncbi:STAS domain-containing protein [bacterium]|nr:STAS domain-containing protein [bacterium]
MQGIRVTVHPVGNRFDITLLSISGYVDTTTCQELARQFQDLIRQKKVHIITNLDGVSYISSAGWGVFMGEIKNIRDQGGDIKLVHMPPEVYEVFEMLEFNRILNCYESVEEAINEFDIIRGIDITRYSPEAKRLILNASPESAPSSKARAQTQAPESPNIHVSVSKLAVKDYPLPEKIKLIVIDNPLLGVRKICKALNTPPFGNIKIGWLKMFRLLKQMNLETKEKRYRYYRSR